MRLQGLIDAFREVAFDTVQPYLFSDNQLILYANEAQVEACRRARLITDSLTADDGIYSTNTFTGTDSTATVTVTADHPICLHTVTASQASIRLDPRVIFVRRVKIASRELPLQKIRREDLDIAHPGWEDGDPGDVIAYCSNYQKFRIFFETKFPAADTVRLTVIREPLFPMSLDVVTTTQTTSGTDTSTITNTATGVDPEIEPRYQLKLIDWMLWRALNNRDVEEKYDPEGAKEHLAMFEGEFGTARPAVEEIWIQERHGYDDYEGVS